MTTFVRLRVMSEPSTGDRPSEKLFDPPARTVARDYFVSLKMALEREAGLVNVQINVPFPGRGFSSPRPCPPRNDIYFSSSSFIKFLGREKSILCLRDINFVETWQD